MFARIKLTSLIACFAMLLLPAFAQGQIFSDTEFLSSDYVTNTNFPGNETINFNIDYSNISRFEGFLNVSIPEAPRTPVGATATTGVFLTANDDTLNSNSGNETFAAIMPTLSNVNVGANTATPNYKVTVDVFHSSAAGFDDGTGAITQTGSTNYSVVGLNQTNTTVQIQELNTGGAGTGGLTGQGLSLAVTADTGASDDYLALYGGAFYADRNLGEEPGQLYTQASNNATAAVNTGLIGRHINDYWEAQGLGFEFDDSDSDVTNNLTRFTGDARTYGPDPNNLEEYYTIPDGQTDPVLTAVKQPLLDAFLTNTDPLHYSCGGDNCGLAGSESLAGNDSLFPGVPYNAWATHELYWIDGEFTYVINSVPVLQFTPDNDGEGGDDNMFNEFSDSGSVLLAFWDRFGGSISINPEGANFVVYDNLVVEEAMAGDAPDIMAFLAANGYLLSEGDPDGDGDWDGNDLLVLQRTNPDGIADWQANYGSGVGGVSGISAVPEPSTAVLLLGVAVGVVCRRQR